MRGIFFLSGILLLAGISASGQEAKLTLKGCIETALQQNIGVQQSEVLMQNAGLNYQQAKNNRLPVLQSNYNYSIYNGRSIDPFTNGYINQQLKSSIMDVQAAIPLFNGLRLRHLIKQNELAFNSATLEWQQRKDELTLQVILAYLQVLSDQDAITLARQQAATSQGQLERLELLAKEGATPPGNVSDLRGQYAGDQLMLASAQGNFESSVLALTQLMNIPYATTLSFDRTGIMETIQPFAVMPDEVYHTAMQQLAAVKAGNLRVNSSIAAVKAASSLYFPTVTLFGGASTNFSSAAMRNTVTGSIEVPNGDYVQLNGANVPVISKQNIYNADPISYGSQFKNNISRGIGLSVSIPIFNAMRTRTAVRLAKNDEKNFRLIADNIRIQLRQAIDQAVININATYNRYTAIQLQADAFAESFRIATTRFDNGVIHSAEYLIAKNNYDRVNASLLAVRYEYMLRKKVLDFYMGRLN
ncbi:MAG TPA: TolC family protein [Ferruginibacter sp.]|nr:TolC family protein [Ferruginibacter sp.]HMP21833.1 TolC family protein [Ferruginibacter sp.]